MYNECMNKTTVYSVVLAVLALIALALVVLMVNRSINQTLDPLQRANSQLGTQVSDLLHPTPTILPDPVTIVDEVQALARLETIRYTVEKVITAETNQGALAGLFGDRLLFVAHGYVVAGIDMNKIQPSDLKLDGAVLKVQLPAAEILVATIDNDKSYVYDRKTGLFSRGDPSLETQARQVAEQEILKSAVEDGILDQALTNAQTYLKWFFESLGYKQVEFLSPSP
jgi:HAMP domain-containing protein